MNIWIVEIGEPMPIESDARLLRYGRFSRYLADRGHNVRWWTSSFSHQARKQIVAEAAEIKHNGVILDVIPGPGYQSAVSLQRVLHQRIFAAGFSKQASARQRPDIVIGTVPSPDIAKRVAQYCEQARVPMILDIRDQWPAELVEIAPPGLRWLARIALDGMYRDMRYACRAASAISSVSDNFLEYALTFAGRSRSDTDFVFPLGYEDRNQYSREQIDAAKDAWRRRGVRDDHMVCCFFGAIGKVCQLGPVIEAARRLNGLQKIQFVMCGKGVLAEKYRSLSADCDNVIWLGWATGVEVAALMEISGLALAPYGRNAKMQMPNKVFEYMAGGLPMVSSLRGEMAGLIDEHNCGLNYESNDSEAFEKCVLQLLNDPAGRSRMGARGRALFESRYTFDIVFENALNSIQTVAQGKC